MGDNSETTVDLLIAEELYQDYLINRNNKLSNNSKFDNLPALVQGDWLAIASKARQLIAQTKKDSNLIKLGDLFIRRDQIKTIAVTDKRIVIAFYNGDSHICLQDKASLVCLLNVLGKIDTVPITPNDELFIRRQLGGEVEGEQDSDPVDRSF